MTRTGYDLGAPPSAGTMDLAGLLSEDGVLQEEDAVAMGLWNNPAFQTLLTDLDITRADIITAAQVENPQLSTMFPLGPKQWEYTLMLPVDVLWLRPIRVAAAQLESKRVSERLVQDGLDVVRDIRVAYVDWQLAVQWAEVVRNGASLRTDIARMAEARLDAGEVAELDVSAIRLDAAQAEAEANRAAYDADAAFQRLCYLLGVATMDTSMIPAPMRAPSKLELDVRQLIDETVASRPDLRAMELAICAAREREQLARKSIWQLQAALPDYNSHGTKGSEAGPGMQLRLPIFHQNQGAVAQACAEQKRLRRQYVDRKEQAAMEIRQAHTRLLQAEEDLRVWRDEILPQAEAAVASARKALEEDGVSLLLVLETTRQLLTARRQSLQAEAQHHRALAELERSVGRTLHHETEAVVEIAPLDDSEIVPPAKPMAEDEVTKEVGDEAEEVTGEVEAAEEMAEDATS